MIKKLLSYVLIFLLIVSSTWADAPSIYKKVASGSVTQANMRISAAAGVSFVDFSDSEAAGNKLINHLGYLLKIKSLSNGAVIQGFVRLAGTAEGLGDELINSYANEVPYNPFVVSIPNITSAVLSVDGYGQTTSLATSNVAVGALVKNVATRTLISGQTPSFAYHNGVANGGTVIMGDGVVTLYVTRLAEHTALNTFINTLISSFSAINSAKQVTTPSATGVTISSTKGGTSLDNWAAKDSAFNWNDPAGFTYELWRVNNTVLLDTDSVLNADATIVMTAGSAEWSAVGIDDSAYLDGRHIIHITDAAGVVAFGYYKSAGAGAVVTTNGGATQNWLYIGTGFSTAGDFTRKVYFVGSP